MKTRTYILFLIIFVVSSCKTGNEITYTNLSYLYNPNVDLQISGMRVYHKNDSISTVFVKYYTSGFMYKQPDAKDYFRADYKFSYQLFQSYESNNIISEGSFVLTDSLYYQNAVTLEFEFPIKARFPGNFLLEVRLTDLNADESILFPKTVYKNSVNNAQNFLPVDEVDNVIYDNWISWKTQFRILCNSLENSELLVDYYNNDFPAAPPPFSQAHANKYKYDPDESFAVKMDKDESEKMQFAQEGIFHFQCTKEDREGLTLFRFHDYYPQVSKPRHLIPPLRYLTSNKEFKQLINAADPKQAVDSFWVATAGSEERALALIKKYYSRVEYANQYFSSYKEGWKTDRGMLYIIFGEPATVYRRTDIETWVYGEQGNRVFLTFDFIKAINLFTENDYELQRQTDFKQQWYNAVLYWRQ